MGGIYPSTLTTIEFQHPFNIIFFLSKIFLYINIMNFAVIIVFCELAGILFFVLGKNKIEI